MESTTETEMTVTELVHVKQEKWEQSNNHQLYRYINVHATLYTFLQDLVFRVGLAVGSFSSNPAQ